VLVEHIIEIESKSAMMSLHSSVMEETGRLGVDIFIDNGGICSVVIDLSIACYARSTLSFSAFPSVSLYDHNFRGSEQHQYI